MLNFLKNLLGIGAAPEPMVENHTAHPNPQNIHLDGAAFRAAYEKDSSAVMLDVRTGMEVSGGTLPDAQHINVMSSDFKQKISGLDKAKTYYVYCKAGGRSDMACSVMHDQGFDVRNLNGGKGSYGK